MTTPPELPPVLTAPPILPAKRQIIPTAVYFVFYILILVVDILLVLRTAASRAPGNLAFAIGMINGGVLVPMGLAVAITHIWKSNRGFRGIIRVLFWASLLVLFSKLSALLNVAR